MDFMNFLAKFQETSVDSQSFHRNFSQTFRTFRHNTEIFGKSPAESQVVTDLANFNQCFGVFTEVFGGIVDFFAKSYVIQRNFLTKFSEYLAFFRIS